MTEDACVALFEPMIALMVESFNKVLRTKIREEVLQKLIPLSEDEKCPIPARGIHQALTNVLASHPDMSQNLKKTVTETLNVFAERLGASKIEEENPKTNKAKELMRKSNGLWSHLNF
jgi:hypothetical protein